MYGVAVAGRTDGRTDARERAGDRKGLEEQAEEMVAAAGTREVERWRTRTREEGERERVVGLRTTSTVRYNCVPRMCRFEGEERQEDGVGRPASRGLGTPLSRARTIGGGGAK